MTADTDARFEQPEIKRTVLATAAVINGSTTMAIPVKLSTISGRTVLVYAILDNMSDSCYVCLDILRKLGAKASAIEPDVTINTMNGPQTLDIERYDDLTVTGYNNNNCVKISAYKRAIHCDKSNLPSPDRAHQYHHLKDVTHLITPLLDIPVGVLIGSNYTEVIQPLETRTSDKGDPYAARTLLGWTMCGGRNTMSPSIRKSFITTTDREIISLLERDFIDTQPTTGLVSQDDLKFLRIMDTDTTVDCSGNYMMPLPFKAQPQLKNNRQQAERRFKGLERKFITDNVYKAEYSKFMEDLIHAGHAEEAPNKPKEGIVWYIPHFGVRHKKKGKLRVVFDASASHDGNSLNSLLLSGPDNLNSLLGILLRFRREPIAVTCDIEQMFYNYLFHRKHRDYLRFLWTD